MDLRPTLVTELSFVAGGNEGEPDDERRRLLSRFLTDRRQRLDPAIPILGEHGRHAQDIGKLVTPDEIADASGINRRWYELAERGEPTRASAAVLRGLGNALRLDAQERAVLLRLATPSFDRRTPRDASLEIRDAFLSLRWYLRKLYACSTTDEVFNLVKETAASFFPESSYVMTASRLPDSRGWTFHEEAIARVSRLDAFTHNRDEVVGPIFASDGAAADDIACFPMISSPGDLITFENYDELHLARMLRQRFGAFKRLHAPMIVTVIRSRADFVGHLYLGDFRKTYDDETNYALVSAIADFASLAASP